MSSCHFECQTQITQWLLSNGLSFLCFALFSLFFSFSFLIAPPFIFPRMITSIVSMYSYANSDASAESSSTSPYYSQTIKPFSWGGLGLVFPTAIFAQIFHHSVPGLQHVRKEKKRKKINQHIHHHQSHFIVCQAKEVTQKDDTARYECSYIHISCFSFICSWTHILCQ